MEKKKSSQVQTLANAGKKKPIRNYEFFVNYGKKNFEAADEEYNPILDRIQSQICTLTLKVSRIENRLADLETKPKEKFIFPFGDMSPPHYAPILPPKRNR